MTVNYSKKNNMKTIGWIQSIVSGLIAFFFSMAFLGFVVDKSSADNSFLAGFVAVLAIIFILLLLKGLKKIWLAKKAENYDFILNTEKHIHFNEITEAYSLKYRTINRQKMLNDLQDLKSNYLASDIYIDMDDDCVYHGKKGRKKDKKKAHKKDIKQAKLNHITAVRKRSKCANCGAPIRSVRNSCEYCGCVY